MNMLTRRHLPPTSTIVINLAEEIIGGERVRKNWTSNFVRRYRDRLESAYLRNIDNMRIKAEYEPIIKQFFDLV